MARGWESKSVESQQSDFEEATDRPRLSQDEIERARKRESLELSRQRVTRELGETKSAVRRAALENALKFLDTELANL